MFLPFLAALFALFGRVKEKAGKDVYKRQRHSRPGENGKEGGRAPTLFSGHPLGHALDILLHGRKCLFNAFHQLELLSLIHI